MKNILMLCIFLSVMAFLLGVGFLEYGYPMLKTKDTLWISSFLGVLVLVMTLLSQRFGKSSLSITSVKEIEDIQNQLATFKVHDPNPIQFSISRNPSIARIQQYLMEITAKLQQHYQSGRQFTQNASHEFQTPLAIIKGNIELLLQSPRLEETESNRLGIILQNTNKLSKLTGALVLLSKIENRPFPDETKVHINKLTEEILEHFNDLTQLQGIKVQVIQEEDIYFLMSNSIAEILLANLIQNAIRHNTKESQIEIEVKTGRCWQISNTGTPLTVPTEQLFRRFERQTETEEGLGLGLSIVQSICERYHIKLEYVYENNWHRVKLFF